MEELESFVIRAKAACYIGGGAKVLSSRQGSHDLTYSDGDWAYRDSYFGGTDFLGQEVTWHLGKPIWAMNYYGYILRPELIDSSGTGQMIKTSLSALYREGRFLGGFRLEMGAMVYEDESDGDVGRFVGSERILVSGVLAYRLSYHGGMIRD